MGPDGSKLDHKGCPVKTQKWYHGFTGVGRKRVPAVIMLDEYHECECWCHKPGGKPPRKKRTKK